MATLEDKILGEKLEYYCSSSEDEDTGDSKADMKSAVLVNDSSPLQERSQERKWQGNSLNTGPKGVVQDWQLYKQAEAQQRDEHEKERLEMLKKMSLTCTSAREDAERKKDEAVERELAELLEDEILQQFQKQRLAEMMKLYGQQQFKFGKVINILSGDQFLSEVEKESDKTTVIVHIYENNISGCKTMNNCMETLAAEYKHIKFCKICSTDAGTSLMFKSKALPALLVYRANQIIGNFIRITDELSDEFYPSDLEGFLIEHGILNDKSKVELNI